MDAAAARTRQRIGQVGVLLAMAAFVTSGCDVAATGSPAAGSPEAGTPRAATAPPAVTAPPTPIVAPTLTLPSAQQTPAAPPASDAALGAVYAALRPKNLRSVLGPRSFVRGEDAQLDYEMVNTSEAAIRVPRTSFAGQAAAWYGVIQTWIERLGADPSLDSCLPNAGRDGNRYAMGGMPGVLGIGDLSVEPGQGQTAIAHIPGQWTSCLPAGRYRYDLEYRRIEAPDEGDAIAHVSIDIALRNPTTWSARFALGGEGSATLTLAGNGSRARSAVDITGLVPGFRYTFEVRAGCERDGAVIVRPVTFVAGSSGDHHDARTVAVSASARKALGAGHAPSIWFFAGGSGACMPYSGIATPLPDGRGPTTWGGSLLRERLGAGITVTASSEFIRPGDGRPSQAFDGDVNRTWNAGASPTAWIEIDLGRDTSVDGLRLLPSQLPAEAATVHRVYGRADGSLKEVLLATVDDVTQDNVWLEVGFAKPRSVRYVRIETVSSPSWVAWREIELPGVELPRPSRMPVGTHDGTTLAYAMGAACQAVGWASDPDAPTNVDIRVMVDGKVVFTGPAGLPRADVAAAGAGDLTSGFEVGLGPFLSSGASHEVRVQARDLETESWVDLAATPRQLTCG